MKDQALKNGTITLHQNLFFRTFFTYTHLVGNRLWQFASRGDDGLSLEDNNSSDLINNVGSVGTDYARFQNKLIDGLQAGLLYQLGIDGNQLSRNLADVGYVRDFAYTPTKGPRQGTLIRYDFLSPNQLHDFALDRSLEKDPLGVDGKGNWEVDLSPEEINILSDPRLDSGQLVHVTAVLLSCLRQIKAQST